MWSSTAPEALLSLSPRGHSLLHAGTRKMQPAGSPPGFRWLLALGFCCFGDGCGQHWLLPRAGGSMNRAQQFSSIRADLPGSLPLSQATPIHRDVGRSKPCGLTTDRPRHAPQPQHSGEQEFPIRQLCLTLHICVSSLGKGGRCHHQIWLCLGPFPDVRRCPGTPSTLQHQLELEDFS